jgi:hypothetical protein
VVGCIVEDIQTGASEEVGLATVCQLVSEQLERGQFKNTQLTGDTLTKSCKDVLDITRICHGRQ